jgi:hypothetical protein
MKATYSISAAKMTEHFVLARSEKIQNKLAEEKNATQTLERQFSEVTRSFSDSKDLLNHH